MTEEIIETIVTVPAAALFEAAELIEKNAINGVSVLETYADVNIIAEKHGVNTDDLMDMAFDWACIGA